MTAAATIWLGRCLLSIRLHPIRATVSFVIGGLLGRTMLGIVVVLLAVPGRPTIHPALEPPDTMGFGPLVAGSVLPFRVLLFTTSSLSIDTRKVHQ